MPSVVIRKGVAARQAPYRRSDPHNTDLTPILSISRPAKGVATAIASAMTETVRPICPRCQPNAWPSGFMKTLRLSRATGVEQAAIPIMHATTTVQRCLKNVHGDPYTSFAALDSDILELLVENTGHPVMNGWLTERQAGPYRPAR